MIRSMHLKSSSSSLVSQSMLKESSSHHTVAPFLLEIIKQIEERRAEFSQWNTLLNIICLSKSNAIDTTSIGETLQAIQAGQFGNHEQSFSNLQKGAVCMLLDLKLFKSAFQTALVIENTKERDEVLEVIACFFIKNKNFSEALEIVSSMDSPSLRIGELLLALLKLEKDFNLQEAAEWILQRSSTPGILIEVVANHLLEKGNVALALQVIQKKTTFLNKSHLEFQKREVKGRKALQKDFEDFLEKIQLQGQPIRLINQTNNPVQLRITFEFRGKTEVVEIFCKPRAPFQVIQGVPGVVLKRMEISQGVFPSFLNIQKKGKEPWTVSIDTSEKLLFPSSMEHHDFWRTYNQLCFTNMFDLDQQGELWEAFEKEEGVRIEELFSRRQKVFDKNNLGRVCHSQALLTENDKPRIPLITHHIWLTTQNNPKELPDQYLAWMKTFPQKNPLSEGWEHLLWVQDKTKLPQSLEKLADSGIQVREIQEIFPNGWVLQEEFEKAVAEKKFGKASDMLRYALVDEIGGLYADTDTQVFHNLRNLFFLYDSIISAEPFPTPCIANHCLATRPKHPMMQECLRLIKRNLDEDLAPSYIKKCTHKLWRTVIETGPAALALAFHKSADQENNIDMIFPSELLFPHGAKIEPTTALVHYSELSWIKDGNNG